MKTKILSIVFILLFCVWFRWGIDFHYGDDGSTPYMMTFWTFGEVFEDGDVRPEPAAQAYCWVIFAGFVAWVIGFVAEFFVKSKTYFKLFSTYTAVFTVVFAGKMLVQDGFGLYGDWKVDLARYSYFLAFACLIMLQFMRNRR